MDRHGLVPLAPSVAGPRGPQGTPETLPAVAQPGVQPWVAGVDEAAALAARLIGGCLKRLTARLVLVGVVVESELFALVLAVALTVVDAFSAVATATDVLVSSTITLGGLAGGYVSVC